MSASLSWNCVSQNSLLYMVWARVGHRVGHSENWKAKMKQQPSLLSEGQTLLQLKPIAGNLPADFRGIRQEPSPELF